MSLRETLTVVNDCAPWPEVVRALGLPTQQASLPARVRCPTCAGVVTVIEDTTNHGVWHHCAGCGYAGDALQFAARHYDLPLDVTLRRLSQDGLLVGDYHLAEEFSAEMVRAYRAREELSDFVSTARETLLRNTRSEALNSLRVRFRLQANYDDSRWRAGPGLCLGACTREELCAHILRRWMQPLSRRAAQPWTDTLLVPFETAPGRPVAVYAVGRAGNREDRHMIPFKFHSNNRHERADIGLAGLSFVGDAGDVVAVSDPLLMARLQCRHFGTSTRALPVVAWHDGDAGVTSASWHCLYDRRVVFWSWEFDDTLWLQVIRADGAVSDAGPDVLDKKSIDHYIRLLAPADLVARVIHKAKPWPEALSAHIVTHGRAVAEALLHRLERAGIDLQGVRMRLTPKARNILGDALVERSATVGVPFGAGRVHDRNHCWYYQSVNRRNPPFMVSDFTMRIDTIDQNPLTYRGRFNIHGVEVPFRLPEHRLHHRPQPAYQEIATKHGHGALFIRGGWSQKIINISLAFFTPEERLPHGATKPQRQGAPLSLDDI